LIRRECGFNCLNRLRALAECWLQPENGTPAAFLGSVDAADEKGAIKAAIEQFGIDDLYVQRRLIAQRQG
jgi:hypothetical protein